MIVSPKTWICLTTCILIIAVECCDANPSSGQSDFSFVQSQVVLKRSFHVLNGRKNEIEVMIDGSEEGAHGLLGQDSFSTLAVNAPLPFEVALDGEPLRLLDPASLDSLVPELPGPGLPVVFLIDDATLPTGAPGTHEMVFSSPAVAQPLRLQVQIGCSDPQRATYLDCIANCAHWEVRW